MFPLKNINSLKNTEEFKKVYHNGKSVANRLLIVYVLKEPGPVRIGISVSKKVGNSVVRHRVTRLIREAYISIKEEIPENTKIIVIAKKSCADKNEKDIESALCYALRKHGIIKNG